MPFNNPKSLFEIYIISKLLYLQDQNYKPSYMNINHYMLPTNYID